MVAVAEVQAEVAETVAEAPETGAARKHRAIKFAALGIALVATAGTVGWQAPQLIERVNRPSYVGADASAVAKDLGCADFKRGGTHDESVYRFRDQGTCVFNNARVTITTFNEAAHGEAFITLMNGLIPVIHPTWTGKATAAGEGWNVADAKTLSPQVAEAAVRQLGAGEVRLIPTAAGRATKPTATPSPAAKASASPAAKASRTPTAAPSSTRR